MLALAAIAVLLPLSSCDDPKLVAERDRLEATLLPLLEEEERLQNEVPDPPMPDRSEELREAEAELDQIKSDVAQAEADNAGLRKKLHEVRQASDDWKEEHPLSGRNNN
jgi:hypothetical protein